MDFAVKFFLTDEVEF